MITGKQEKIKSIFRKNMLPLFVNLIGPVSADLETAIIESCKLIDAVKDQSIAEGGESEDGQLIYFESGLARCFYYTATDKLIITRITKKDEVLIDVNTYLYRSTRAENIQMLEKGTLVTMTYKNLKLLLFKFPSLYPILLNFLAKRERQHFDYQHLLKLPVEERVKIFLYDNPGITSRIKNDYIAAYLHMSRTTFSSAYKKYRAENDEN